MKPKLEVELTPVDMQVALNDAHELIAMLREDWPDDPTQAKAALILAILIMNRTSGIPLDLLFSEMREIDAGLIKFH